MYREFGFGDKMVLVGGDYSRRLASAVALVDDLLKLKQK